MNPTEAIAWYVVFLFSTTLHEAAHAWAALKGGDDTAYLGGQVSLDPTPHIRREPIGMVVLPLLFLFINGWPLGYASAPYDASWAYRFPKRSALMALAGPAANLSLAIASGLIMVIGIHAGMFQLGYGGAFSGIVGAEGGGALGTLAFLLSLTFSLNVLLMTFNLIPLPPLDGSAALGLVLPEDTARRWQEITHQPMVQLIGLLLVYKFAGPLIGGVLVQAIGILVALT